MHWYLGLSQLCTFSYLSHLTVTVHALTLSAALSSSYLSRGQQRRAIWVFTAAVQWADADCRVARPNSSGQGTLLMLFTFNRLGYGQSHSTTMWSVRFQRLDLGWACKSLMGLLKKNYYIWTEKKLECHEQTGGGKEGSVMSVCNAHKIKEFDSN